VCVCERGRDVYVCVRGSDVREEEICVCERKRCVCVCESECVFAPIPLPPNSHTTHTPFPPDSFCNTHTHFFISTLLLSFIGLFYPLL